MANTSTAPLRPTIIVGIGWFGQQALRRLLISTAPRGVLEWSRPPGAGPDQRRLFNLILLWVPPQGYDPNFQDPDDGGDSEILRDLYRQIQVVPRNGQQSGLADALDRAQQELLSVAARQGAPQPQMPLGLDIFVLAQPRSEQEVGELSRIMHEGMERLDNNPGLRRGVEGASPLSLTHLLDFENYWSREPTMRSVRNAMADLVKLWHAPMGGDPGAKGYFFLVDGRGSAGVQDEVTRTDTLSLFLELLLFERQRSGPFQRLFEEVRDGPVATFSVHLLEDSPGLVSRLAAACFGIGWLRYMAGGSHQHPLPKSRLHDTLDAFHPKQMGKMLNREAHRRDLDETLAALREELIKYSPDAPDWCEHLEHRHRSTALEIEGRFSDTIGKDLRRIISQDLKGLSTRLADNVDTDLTNSERPLSLATVIAEAETLLHSIMGDAPGQSATPEGPTKPLDGLRRLHRAYLRFLRLRLQTHDQHWHWGIFSLLLAIACVPPLRNWLISIPQPDPGNALLQHLYTATHWLDHPVWATLALTLLFFPLSLLLIRRLLLFTLKTWRAYWIDSNGGRFPNWLRKALSPGGALSSPLEALLEQMHSDASVAIRSEVAREVHSVVHRLRQRQQEAQWLTEQLTLFLKRFGLHGPCDAPTSQQIPHDPAEHQLTSFRSSLWSAKDIAEKLQRNPPTEERFVSVYREHKPLKDWQREHNHSFLFPFEFIDQLKDLYEEDEPIEGLNEAQESHLVRERSEKLGQFLARHGELPLVFDWQDEEQSPWDQRFCVLPRGWERSHGLGQRLSEARVPREHMITGHDRNRLYLVRIKTGGDPESLRGKER